MLVAGFQIVIALGGERCLQVALSFLGCLFNSSHQFANVLVSYLAAAVDDSFLASRFVGTGWDLPNLLKLRESTLLL